MKRSFLPEYIILNEDIFNEGVKTHDLNLIKADNFIIIVETPMSEFQTKQQENGSIPHPEAHSYPPDLVDTCRLHCQSWQNSSQDREKLHNKNRFGARENTKSYKV